MTVVICHFYNEEYLLPWWLSHHAKLFDHGVMVDYGSTDGSVDCIRELVPTWEIVPSRNENFSAASCDAEVMDIERRFAGWWKLVLNVTEFLHCADLPSTIANLGGRAVKTDGIIMIDPPELRGVEPDPRKSLVLQRFWGVNERFHPLSGRIGRQRLLHCHDSGEYHVGRHDSAHPADVDESLMCLWYAFSPMTQRLIRRKVQIQDRIPAADFHQGFGIHHRTDELFQHSQYEQWAEFTGDLRSNEHFLRALSRLHTA